MNLDEINKRIKSAHSVNNNEQAKALLEEGTLFSNRLFKVSDNIVYFYELEYVSLDTVYAFKTELEELVKDKDEFILILNLSKASRPSAKVRNELSKIFQHKKISFIYIYTGSNFLLKIAAMFVLSFTKKDIYEVVNTVEEALEKANKKK